ncbi:MAG: phosphatidylserine decarboxylase [Chlamydiae bacterium]|nr:phosphatidylserine decarboxylase [Chlamydiota bacterium]
MKKILFLDRVSQTIQEEKVYGESFLQFFYGEGRLSRWFSPWLLPILACHPLASRLYGHMQKSRWSRKKIEPFIHTFSVDTSEFLEPVSHFASFNDFFTRRLKPASRPVAAGGDVAVLPADGRYLVYPDISKSDGFLVKGRSFCLRELLQSSSLYEAYKDGTLVLARLCPTDYHRFHFPVHCIPSVARPMKGDLYSVNPIALRKRIEILAQNKRQLTLLQTKNFGRVLFIEVGATFVGSIHQTFVPGESYAKGDEKGYFSFGGSTLLLFFEQGRIQLDQDLIEASASRLEVKGLMGQSLGRSLTP